MGLLSRLVLSLKKPARPISFGLLDRPLTARTRNNVIYLVCHRSYLRRFYTRFRFLSILKAN